METKRFVPTPESEKLFTQNSTYTVEQKPESIFSLGTPEKTKRRYPEFLSQQTITIPKNGNILINDLYPFIPSFIETEKLDELIKDLASKSEREIVLFDAMDLTLRLQKLLPPREFFASNRVAVLFPGKGAKAVRDTTGMLNLNMPAPNNQIFSFPCKKSFWRGKYEGIDLTLPQYLKPDYFDAFLIIDDVVVTGETVRKIVNVVNQNTTPDKNFEWGQSQKFPNWPSLKKPKPFFLVTLLGLYPNQKPQQYRDNSGSSISKIESVSTAICYKGQAGIPPCNSLSTLVRKDQKAKLVGRTLKSKYFDKETFDELINYLRGQAPIPGL